MAASDNYTGNGSFTYTVKDNSGNTSLNTATYTIPMNLPPVTSNVTAGSIAPGSARAGIPALVGSDDGFISFFSILTLPSPAEGTLYLNNVAVNSLSQVDSLSVLQAGQLSFAPSATFDGTIFTYTATDNLGIIDVSPAVYTIPYTAGVLSVELFSFSGRKEGAHNLLTWTTSQENNLGHFEIEISKDGLTFTNIGSLMANGNTTNRSDYSFTDANPASGFVYYRLKMVDRDAGFRYSNVIALKRDEMDFVISSILPNPFTERIVLNLVVDIDQLVTINLYDISGRVIKTKKYSAVKGMNTFEMKDVQSLNAGMYIIEAKNESLRLSAKLVKAN